MRAVVSIGNQDFGSIRERDSFYIDKTSFIKEWWENEDIVTLITRPRRFGKTLSLSMLEYFFSNQYNGHQGLFEGLAIWEHESYRELQGSLPVIFVSFADVKGKTYQHVRDGMICSLQDAYRRHAYILEGLNEAEKIDFYAIDRYLMNEDTDRSISDITVTKALKNLSFYLNRHYGKKVLILLDEYDTPQQEAYVGGFWEELVDFVRSMFNATFKTNPYLERGLMTGITRVSKESIFSDLNNLEIVTTTSEKYETAFGFTENEVEQALGSFGLAGTMEQVRVWYDGFRFGNRSDIYNPWSITKYLDSGKLGAYWANTSSNSLAGKLIREGTADIKMDMETLLDQGQIEATIEEEIVYSQLEESDGAIWSLLLASGYLKVEKAPEETNGSYGLSLTNYEVRLMFQRMIQGWFGRSSVKYNDFVKALFAGDLRYMNRFMNQITEAVFSYFDTGKQPSGQEPERFYHGFVLGLIADSRIDYVITSNRESGFGRYDVVMEPRKDGQDAYVFEFKVHDPDREKTLQDTVEAALEQIVEKNYGAQLVDRGIPKERIRYYGFAFEGKRVLIGQPA